MTLLDASGRPLRRRIGFVGGLAAEKAGASGRLEPAIGFFYFTPGETEMNTSTQFPDLNGATALPAVKLRKAPKGPTHPMARKLPPLKKKDGCQ